MIHGIKEKGKERWAETVWEYEENRWKRRDKSGDKVTTSHTIVII